MGKTDCAKVPELARLNYFYGQVLGHHELRTEQAYFREKQRLHNRCLHGYGVVCGLEIKPQAPPPAEPCPPGTAKPMVKLECGLALDCLGNEIVVRHERANIDLWCELGADGQKAVESGKTDIYIYICFKERYTDPSRPAMPDSCGNSNDCQYGKIEDCWELRVTTEPECDERCETCCETCEHACLLLAKICNFKKDHPVWPYDIHNGVRRMVSQYQYTTITGINWVQGATYSHHHVQHLLRQGLRFQFSKPVHTDTLIDGVADIWVVHDERMTEVWCLESEIEVPPTEFTDWMVVKQSLKELLQDGDRVLITLRAEFILDRCCRPVDGMHIGGRVPFIGEPNEDERKCLEKQHCQHPPGRPGPWTSGNNNGGSTFQSWFWIREDVVREEIEEIERFETRRRPGGGK